MRIDLDDRDLILLECIRLAGEPLGSWSLVAKMEKKGFKLSSASIGRILYRLESLGLVESQANKGRVLTKEGSRAINNASVSKSITRHSQELEKLIDSHILDEYIMVLQARRAIERETARLAAQNISETELRQLEEIIADQEDKASRGESIAKVDIDFHKKIAEASTNSVLSTLYGILAMLGQQTELFEYMRKSVGASYRTAHRSILDALKKHDPEEAERYMLAHVDRLMENVRKYWEHYRE